MGQIFDIIARLVIDKGNSEAELGSLKAKTDALAQAIPLTVDTGDAVAKTEEVAGATQQVVRSVNDWKAKLVELKAARDASEDPAKISELNAQIATATGEVKKLSGAFDKKPVDEFNADIEKVGSLVKHQESSLDSFKEKTKDTFGEGLKKSLEFASGGLLAAGIEGFASNIVAKAREADNAADTLSIALTRTGLSGEAAKAEIDRLGESAEKIADAFALPQSQVTLLQAKIAGFSGVSGTELDKLTELSIGAANVLQMPAEAVAKMIAKSADPEQAASLAKIGIVFDKNATAAEKMAIIQAKLGPSIEETKASTQDAVGQMDRWINSTEEFALKIATGVLNVAIPALQGLVGFVSENKVALGVLAIGAGALAISMNAAAIGTGALTIAQKAQAIGTGIVTGAQTLLNAVMEANPIGLVVAGIAALAAGAIFLYNNVRPVHDAFDAIWSVLKATGAFIGSFVQNEVAALAAGFSGVGKVLDGIVHLDFNEVKAGAAEVGGAVTKHMSAGVDATQAFGKSLDASKKALAEQGEAGTKSGQAVVDGAKAAAQAQVDLVAAIGKANDEFSAQFDERAKQREFDKATYLRQLDEIKSGEALVNGQRVKLTEAELEARRKGNADFIAQAKQINAEALVQKKAGDEFDRLTNAEQKARTENLLELAKKQAETESKKLEISLQLQRAAQGIGLSDQDNLAIADKFNSTLIDQITTRKLLASTKYSVAAQLALDDSKIKDLTLSAKVRIDIDKSQADLDTSFLTLARKEIEVGIRPKSDTLDIIERERAAIQSKLDAINFDPSDPAAFARAQKEVNDLTDQLLAKDAEARAFKASGEKELSDLRIGLMDNEFEVQLFKRGQQLQSDLQFVRDANEQGRELNAQELAKESLINEQYSKDIAKIRIAQARDANKEILKLEESLFDEGFKSLVDT